MDFLQRNLFTKLRSAHFGIEEEMEPMTTFKQQKIAQMMKNLNDVPAGEVRMNNGFLNRRSPTSRKMSVTPSILPSRPCICCASSCQTSMAFLPTAST